MDRDRCLYLCGVGLGIALGLFSFQLGCPWSSCIEPSLRLSHHRHHHNSAPQPWR